MFGTLFYEFHYFYGLESAQNCENTMVLTKDMLSPYTAS